MLKLSTIRDLLIIIAVYLYFIAWVYIHIYYSHFGITAESLRLDYSAYLVFSYNVLDSHSFYVFAAWSLTVIIIYVFFFSWIFRKVVIRWRRTVIRANRLLVILAMVSLFPFLYPIARQIAMNDYVNVRVGEGDRHKIEFIFRPDAGFQADTTSSDISRIRNDHGGSLYLLGESNEYYIVLRQAPYNKKFKVYPEGAVYYINKKDVLLAHILLDSF